MKTVSTNKCFGGTQGVYTHTSAACACDMTFGLFLPEEAADGPVPVLWYLSGLTCTHENAMAKAGAQSWAAEQGIALVFPDTSPRGDAVADDEAYDLGQRRRILRECQPEPVGTALSDARLHCRRIAILDRWEFSIDMDRQAITGHSMGGHGALTLAMGLPGRFRSVSAFAPICQPTASDWGTQTAERLSGG